VAKILQGSRMENCTPAGSVVRHDWIFKGDLVLWSDETEKKKSFLAANPPDGFGANRHNKYPMSTVKGVVHLKKKKKKTFSDNLLTPMSSKISMSFFLQSKRN